MRKMLTQARAQGGKRNHGLIGRLGVSIALMVGIPATAITLAAAPASAAAPTLTCTAPAAGGTATNFDVGFANTYTVSCTEVSGVSGTAAYPASITLASGTLPADASEATSTASSPACTTSHSGSGATESYILSCPIAETPTAADEGSYPVTFTATGTAVSGVTPGPVTSGTWTLNVVNGSATACSAPAAAGTATTFTVGTASTYSVACYGTGGASYPSTILLNSGSLPADATFPNTTTQGCTQSTSGSGATEEFILTCKISETPTAADEGTYTATFQALGANGAPNAVSGTLTLSVKQAAPTWVSGQYFAALKGVPFCDDIAVSNAAALPLTSMTAGTTPSGITNYALANVNLTAGTAQICGTDTNTPASSGTPPAMAPVATNTGGSATDSIPIGSYGPCTWTTSKGTTSMFDANQDLEQTGSQSAFGAAIVNGETLGSTSNYTTCSGDAMVAASGGLGDAWTVNTANPLPTPTDTNPSGTAGDLPSSNLFLATGGCYGAVNILSSYSYTTFGSGTSLTTPSPWVNGGTCKYGSLGSNEAGGNTDTTNATCPPSQADVNEGYVSCSITASSGNDENGSVNYTTDDLFYSGQPVPQQSTASLSSSSSLPGQTVSVTGGSNWWGSSGGAPNTGPYGDAQAGAYYPVSSPGVFIGTSRATAVPVVNSTVTISANQYVCTGAESATVGPNPCTMTVGQPLGTFQIPSGLPAGSYNVYIDESNTTPLPGNGPNDAYQTARGTNLGTAESVTPLTLGTAPSITSSNTASVAEGIGDLNFTVTTSGVPNPALSESGALPSGVTFTDNGNGTASLAGTPAWGTAGSYPITITASNGVTPNATQSFTLTVSPSASLSLTKSTTSTGYGAAGDTIPYSYLVTNTGNTTLSGVAVSDNLVPSVDCPEPSLSSGAAETCTGSYTVTQADVDHGSVTNTATASATTLGDTTVQSNSSSVTVDATYAISSVSLATTTTSTGYGAAGDTIPYSYLVTNTGTTTLSGIAVSDELVPTVICPDSSLAPGASETCAGSYTVTQADVDTGSVMDEATAGATTPSDTSIASNQTTVTVEASNATSSLSLTKSTTSTGYGSAGETIPYTYLVTNTGTMTIYNVAVSDDLVSPVVCPQSTLAPAAAETCTGSYTVTQADVDNGSVTNTATADGNTLAGTAVNSASSSVTVPASGATSSLSLAKSTTSTGYGSAGETIPYTYLVTNTGTTTLSGVAVSDDLVASVSCPDPSLAPGASETCTGTYTVTQADVDNGSVTNTATASATDPDSVIVTSASSSVTVDATNATSSLSLAKSTTSTGYAAAGDVLDYTYLVTNTGTTTLNNVAVSDDLVASVSCPDPSLAPGASETCTGSYTVTQADVDNGAVTNTATASSTNPQDTAVSSASSSVTVYAAGVISSLSLDKSTTSTGYGAAGDTIPYSYLVTNTGTSTLTNVAVSDDLVASVSCPDPTLQPTDSETCTGSYTVTQADVDDGSVTNTATASATGAGHATVSSGSSSVTVYASDATSSLSLVKSTTSTGYSEAGDTIAYSYLVTNTGTTTLSAISVSDDHVATVTCPDPSLAPGASETCTGTYTVTQADVDNGSVTNTATATATGLSGSVSSNSPSLTVYASGATASMTLTKSTTSTGYGAAGDTIPYSYLVTNTGTLTLKNVAVSDDLVASVSCPHSSLAPEASETCTGTYTVTQADVDNGSVTNSATGTATAKGSTAVTSNTSEVTVDASNATSTLDLVKSTTSTGYSAAGDTIPYSYLVTNTGTTTLGDISVTDDLVSSVDCPHSSLAPGASETCTGSYTVTQADVDAGSVTNTATAAAVDPSGTDVTSPSSSVTVEVANATSSLSLAKSTTSTGYGAAGDTIPYSYLVTNTGTTTLHSVGVSDNLVAAVSCPDSSLAPGASETCTGTYTVTQADVDNGSVTNTATASATNPLGTKVTSASSSVTVNATNATSSLSLVKSTTSTGYGAAGDTIPYSYLVTNTGTTTLDNVAVRDDHIAGVSCPDSSLAPGASETCTGTYTVTQADVDHGSVTNTATASATNPSDTPVSSASSSVTVEAAGATSALGLTVSASPTTFTHAGTVIHYSYGVTNTGSTTLHGVAVSDTAAGAASCPQGTLTPGASETCTGSYTTTATDVDNGSVTDSATAHATNPSGTPVSSASASTTVSDSAPNELHITTTGLTPAEKGVAYKVRLAAAGGTAPYTWSIKSGALPAGLTLNANGKIAGTPTKQGSFTITFKVVDSASPKDKATATLTLVVDP